MQPPAAAPHEFTGYEFDWLALDRAGAIGLFSTAGFGEIPAEVLRQAPAHRVIAERLNALTRNTVEPWAPYGQLGLFVFDWQHWNGPYRKEASPQAEISADLRNEILSIPNLPTLDLDFSQVASVTVPRFEAKPPRPLATPAPVRPLPPNCKPAARP